MDFYQRIQLKGLLDDVNVYCMAAKNSAIANKVKDESYFKPEVENWKHFYAGKPFPYVCSEIARLARQANINYQWDELDVDGFCWHIAVFSLICEEADIVPNFESAFKEAYKIYIEETLRIDLEKKDIRALINLSESGDADAQFKLAMAYVNGKDLSKNPSKATYWFEKAAMQGHVIAQYNIGQSYEKGIGVQVNEYKAFYWYMKAAENGDTDAISNVGLFYYLGKGTAIDYKKAVSYWTKASELNDDRATFNLGICYRDGQGVGEDWYKARELFEKAIKLGHPKASSALDQLNRRM